MFKDFRIKQECPVLVWSFPSHNWLISESQKVLLNRMQNNLIKFYIFDYEHSSPQLIFKLIQVLLFDVGKKNI